MSARDKDHEELEVTAQPKTLPEELPMAAPTPEVGLSVDPEDLGRQFLSGATEQQNFESYRAGETADLWINTAGPSDEPLPGPNFENEGTVWESTVELSMQSGGPEGAQALVSPATVDDEDSQSDGLRLIDPLEGDIDVTEPVVQEASLLDHEAEELGQTVEPELRTDDSKSHGKKRGGHARKGARGPSRSR